MKKDYFSGSKIPFVQLSLIFLGIALWPEMELLVPSLPNMKDFFMVSEGEIQQVLSANFIGFLIGVMFAGPICDSFGRRNTTVVGLIVFILSSVFVSVSNTLEIMMVARFIQGLAMTLPVIGSITMLMETTSGPRQTFWISMSSSSITFAMASAPLIGAVINDAWGFRANLWSIVIMAFFALIPFYFLAPETLAKEKRSQLNFSSLCKNYWEIFTNKEFMGLAIAVSALPAAYWIYTGVSSLYLVDHLGIDSKDFGSYQAPIAGTFAVLSLSITYLAKRLGAKNCIRLGFYAMLLGSGSLLVMSILNHESAMLTTIFMMIFVSGMVPANSLLFPSAIQKLPNHLQGSGQSVIQALRLLIASIGTLILGVTYSGPFLPVAIILVVTFILSAILIAKSDHNLEASQSEEAGALAPSH